MNKDQYQLHSHINILLNICNFQKYSNNHIVQLIQYGYL